MAPDLQSLRALTSTPLVRVTFERARGGEPLVHLGHALGDEFVPAGRDLDAALDAAQAMSRESRDLLASTEPAKRATGVLQASDGELYLVGLNADPRHPDVARVAVLELRDGIVRPAPDSALRSVAMSNQYTAPNISLDGPFDAGIRQPVVESLVPELVGIAGVDVRARMAPGAAWTVPAPS